MPGSELGKRLVVAAVGIPVAVLALYAGGWTLGLIIAVIAGLGAAEYYRLAARQEIRAFALPGVLFAATLVLTSTALPDPTTAAPLLWQMSVAFLVLLSGIAIWDRGPDGRPLAAVAVTLTGALVPAATLAFVLFIRHMPPFDALERWTAGWGSWTGAAIVAYPLAVTWVNDTAAYFGGIRFGTRKLIPSVSPGKTWFGMVAGLAAGVLAGFLWSVFVLDAWRNVGLDPWLGALGGLVIAAVAQVGDLAVSVLKREAGVKDSGSVLPGHGGVLDRFDDLFFVLPVAYWFLVLAFRWSGVAP